MTRRWIAFYRFVLHVPGRSIPGMPPDVFSENFEAEFRALPPMQAAVVAQQILDGMRSRAQQRKQG